MESARLFYALWPDDDVRTALQRLQVMLRGRHTHRDNLHVTLAFLGQQPMERLPALKNILTNLPACDITLELDRIGYFQKSRIAWAGMHATPATLLALQSALSRTLEQCGIALDRQHHFKPHVTLAREAEAPIAAPFEPIVWQATQAALVQSVQSGAGAAYRVLALRSLTRPG